MGTGPHGPSVSLSSDDVEGLSFASLGAGDGLEDASMSFVADLDNANAALAALTVHTTADEGAMIASGVLSLGACDSEELTTAVDRTETAWSDSVMIGGCSDGGWGEQNVTFGYRIGTMPKLESVWPVAAPVAGGLTVEVRGFPWET